MTQITPISPEAAGESALDVAGAEASTPAAEPLTPTPDAEPRAPTPAAGPDWVPVHLGDVAEIRYGKSLPWNQRRPGPYPVYGSSGVVGTHDQSLVDGPGIIIGRKGTIGTVFLCETPFWPIDTVYYIIKVREDCLLRYVYQALRTMGLPRLDEDTAVPGLNSTTLAERPFKLPPLDEQERLVRALGAIDDKMAVLRDQIRTITTLSDDYYRALFVEDRGEERPKTVARDFGPIVCGTTPPTRIKDFFDGATPFVKIPDMRDNPYILETGQTLSEAGRRRVGASHVAPAGSLQVSCLGTVGLVSMSVIESASNQQINSLTPRDPRHLIYLFCVFRSLEDELKALASGSTVTPNLNLTDFSKIPVAWPDPEPLDKFNDLVEPLFRRVLENQRQLISLRGLKDLLTPRLVDRTISLASTSPPRTTPRAPVQAAPKPSSGIPPIPAAPPASALPPGRPRKAKPIRRIVPRLPGL